MKEKIKNFIKSITAKKLIIFIIVAFIFDKILYYWLGAWLVHILPLTISGTISLHLFIRDFGTILEFSYVIALIWLIIKGLKGLGRKDYERKN